MVNPSAPETGGERRRLAQAALEGYANGPDAPIQATAEALTKAESARSVILVEGISDQIAVEAVAVGQGRDLDAEEVVVVPIGGAQAASRYLTRFGPTGAGVAVTGLCDAAEEVFFRKGLADAGFGRPKNRTEMEGLGFFVCVDDLEEELIRAADHAAIESLLDSQGDLGSFRTMQKQPEWRHHAFEAQIHRWLRSGARRSLRYARLLVLALDLDRIPQPLLSVVAAATDPR